MGGQKGLESWTDKSMGSFWDNETVLKLIVVTAEQFCEYTKVIKK